MYVRLDAYPKYSRYEGLHDDYALGDLIRCLAYERVRISEYADWEEWFLLEAKGPVSLYFNVRPDDFFDYQLLYSYVDDSTEPRPRYMFWAKKEHVSIAESSLMNNQQVLSLLSSEN